ASTGRCRRGGASWAPTPRAGPARRSDRKHRPGSSDPCSHPEIALARFELLPVDLAAGVAPAQDFDRLVVMARTALAHEPADAEDEARDHDGPEREHH